MVTILKMIYKIDQSGKVEEISKDTVLAISNGHSFAIKITSKTKIALKQMFSKSGRNKKDCKLWFKN